MSGEMVKRLRDRRLNVWEQAKTLADKAAEENRAFSAEEQGTWDALNDELDALDKRIKSALDTEARAKEADDAFNKLHGQQVVNRRTTGSTSDGQQHGDELRAFLRGERGRVYEIRPDGSVPADLRILINAAAPSGGPTVPTSFYNRLVAHLIEVSAVLQAGATVLNTDSGESLQVPKTTAHGNATLFGESVAITGTDPGFQQATLGAYKYGTLLQVSRELLTDTGVDLEGYLAMQAGRALGNLMGSQFITGTGSSMPAGLITGSTQGALGPTGVSGALGPTDATANSGADLLFDLFYSVIAPYRASRACAWITADTTMAVIRKIKDTTGQYIFQPSLVAGTPDTLIGKPIYTDPFVPAMVTSAKSILFGDISQYFIRLAGGLRFERSDDYAFNTDLVTFRAVMRGDGVLVDQTGAVKHFKGANT